MLHAQLGRRRAPASPFTLEVDRDAVAPGERLAARLTGLAEPAEVSFVRIEQGPPGRLRVPCAHALVEPGDGGDAACTLRVPDRVAPTSTGDRCAIRFAVRARSPVHARRPLVVERPVVVAAGGQPVHAESRLSDRMIANFPSRHFHIELSDAVLSGGGRIAGRVHIDRAVGGGWLELAVQCLECWRTSPPSLWWRQPPAWSWRTLWTATQRVKLDAASHWQGFCFDLAAGLPPAVEGYAIAWRYEIEARRPARLRPGERAMITPLLYEIG